jgi:hypothetical protein
MNGSKCPFSAPLVTHLFGCSRAQEVVRRGGAEIDCTDAAASDRCLRLFDRLKAAALPAFGVEDDLLTMPHSVLVKIQHGGLLGLQRLVSGASADVDHIDDVDALVTGVGMRYGDSLPLDEVVVDITTYKTRGRRTR